MRGATGGRQPLRPWRDRYRWRDRLACGARQRRRLAAALLEAIDDPAERARRGARGHSVAVERHSWPALAQGLADVLDAAVADAPAHGRLA